MRKFLGAVAVLAVGIAIPASFEGTWFVRAFWLVAAVAMAALIALSPTVKGWVPWRLQRKNPTADEFIAHVMKLYLLRRDLQTAAHALDETLKKPSVSELRAFADNLATRLRDAGYGMSAKKVEVQLPDNATPADVEARRYDLHVALWRMLLWDEFS